MLTHRISKLLVLIMLVIASVSTTRQCSNTRKLSCITRGLLAPRMAPRSASHKTQVSVLVFANNANGTSFCRPLGALSCNILAHCTTECPDILHVRDHRAVRASRICRRCVLCAGSPSEVRGRPCGRARTFTAGRAMVEVAHEQGVGSDDR